MFNFPIMAIGRSVKWGTKGNWIYAACDNGNDSNPTTPPIRSKHIHWNRIYTHAGPIHIRWYLSQWRRPPCIQSYAPEPLDRTPSGGPPQIYIWANYRPTYKEVINIHMESQVFSLSNNRMTISNGVLINFLLSNLSNIHSQILIKFLLVLISLKMHNLL